MSDTAQSILNTFDALPAQDRKEVADEILRRVAGLEYGSVDEETLDRLADELFVTLDREETANEKS